MLSVDRTIIEVFIDIFTVRDLREHTEALIHNAGEGRLSLITKHGRPIFLAVPFSEELVNFGLPLAIAIKLYKEETVTLEKAAKIANVSLEGFIEKLGKLGIPVVTYSEVELE